MNIINKSFVFGQVVRFNEYKNTVKIRPFFTDDPKNLGTCFIDKSPMLVLKNLIQNNRMWNAKIESGAQCKDLVGRSVIIPELLHLQNQNVFYSHDLIGMDVLDNGKYCGNIENLENFGFEDIITLRLKDSKIISLIFSDQNFPEINLKEGFVTVKFPKMLDESQI